MNPPVVPISAMPPDPRTKNTSPGAMATDAPEEAAEGTLGVAKGALRCRSNGSLCWREVVGKTHAALHETSEGVAGGGEGEADRGDPGATRKLRAILGADTFTGELALTGECAGEREPWLNGKELSGKARAEAANDDSEWKLGEGDKLKLVDGDRLRLEPAQVLTVGDADR
jgi:hypothetical protein